MTLLTETEIVLGVLLSVLVIVICLSLYYTREKKGSDTFTEAMRGFHGGKLKGGGGASEFAYILVMLAVMGVILWLLNTTMKHL
jgi:preprotein translocase subunit SecE